MGTTIELGSSTLLGVITPDKPSPTKKRDEGDYTVRKKVVDKENELVSECNVIQDSCNDSVHKGPIKRANRRSRLRERHVDKPKSQVISLNSELAMPEQSDNLFDTTTPVASPQPQSSHLPSLDLTPIASPQVHSRLPSLDGPLPLADDQSTPCMTEKEKRRKSSFGFSKLDSPHFRSSLSPAIDSFAYPPSPEDKQTEKSYKKLLKSYALPVAVPKRQPPKRKTKTEVSLIFKHKN